MRRFRLIVAVALAFALAAGAAAHGARAAAMAMPMAMALSGAVEAPCDMCDGGAAEAAAQCALACAGMAGVIDDAALVRHEAAEVPTVSLPAASNGRFAAPEPDPPR